MSDVLELVDVSVVRDGRALVDDVSWSVKEGERWVILGPNGAGEDHPPQHRLQLPLPQHRHGQDPR